MISARNYAAQAEARLREWASTLREYKAALADLALDDLLSEIRRRAGGERLEMPL